MSKASGILGSLSQMTFDGIHISNICTKANRTFGFLRQNLYFCPQEVKEAAYKRLVRPVLEYSGSVWDSSGVGLQNELEKVQNQAARFVTGNYNFETGLTNKRQEETRSDKKWQEASRTYFGVVLSFKCYILTNYDIRKVSDIILWSYNL